MTSTIPNQCQIDECTKLSLTRGFCNGHYHRLIRYGTPTGVPTVQRKPRRVCEVEACDSVYMARGLCKRHYERMVKHGTTSTDWEFHGMSHTREYRSWYQMKSRCYDKNHHAYKDYGGRGISVCDKWFASFVTFYKDMGKRPEGMTLDRINNDGDYESSNCKWSTASEQARNRRTRIKPRS